MLSAAGALAARLCSGGVPAAVDGEDVPRHGIQSCGVTDQC